MLKQIRLATTLLCLLPAAPAPSAEVAGAPYQVVESNVAAYPVGDMLPEVPSQGALPEGGFVSLLDRDDRTILIENPVRPHIEAGTRDVKPLAK